MSRNKIILSFEYDGVLSTEAVSRFVRGLGSEYECIVVSDRCDAYHGGNNGDMIKILHKCNIRPGRVFLCNLQYKHEWMNESCIDIHFDNNSEHISLIEQYTRTIGVNVSMIGWEERFKRIIERRA